FDHGMAWKGRSAGDVVTSDGDLVTGIENTAASFVSRGVLLDVGRCFAPDTVQPPDAIAITPQQLRDTARSKGVCFTRGDVLVVRTGQLERAKREGWGDYAGGPAPGLSLTCAGWIHRAEVAAVATDTWGFEVRPNEFDVPAFQPLHQVSIPNIGLSIGEMWDLDELAELCAAEARWEFMLVAPALPITGAVGTPVNPLAIL